MDANHIELPTIPGSGGDGAGFDQVRYLDMIGGMAGAMDLISPAVANHHARVGYFAARLGAVLGLSDTDRRDLVLAGLMHDAGALSLKTRLDALAFDSDEHTHADIGSRLVRTCPGLLRAAELIRYHHTPYRELQRVPGASALSNLLCLADRIDVLIDRDRPVPLQSKIVVDRIRSSASLFRPEYLEAFLDSTLEGDLWERAEAPLENLEQAAPGNLVQNLMTAEELLAFSRLMSQVIDFRSRFTATHSRGVATVAELLSGLAGFTTKERQLMAVAGNLHDLGKLAVSRNLLEKPGPLTPEEFVLMKKHALHTERILCKVAGLERVCEWAAAHHERMDGTGYPNNLRGEELSLGARILAVADVFTALAENRPYRPGMKLEQIRELLRRMVAENGLDGYVVDLLLDNHELNNAERLAEQSRAYGEFVRFYAPKAE